MKNQFRTIIRQTTVIGALATCLFMVAGVLSSNVAHAATAKAVMINTAREYDFTGTGHDLTRVHQGWGRANVGEGDVIVLSIMEHHSNLVPWQLLSHVTGARLEFVDLDARGRLILDRDPLYTRAFRKCLCRVIPLGERHLRHLVSEYVAHYHGERNHQGLGNELIEQIAVNTNSGEGVVRRRARLGGVLSYYYRDAA